MLDIPGGFGKVALDGTAPDDDGRYRLRDFRGRTHLYPPAT
jgi:lysine 2,3-aminomutase